MKSVLLRIVSVFGSSALGAVAGGAIVNVEIWKAAAIAGIMATAKVVEALLKAYADDGKIDAKELKAAFAFVDKPEVEE
jgi:archaellum component FlaG (FlaF/FlaG flagellin family)